MVVRSVQRSTHVVLIVKSVVTTALKWQIQSAVLMKFTAVIPTIQSAALMDIAVLQTIVCVVLKATIVVLRATSVMEPLV